MPFSPLPGTFIEDLDRVVGAGVLELGSGQGDFTALLKELGHEPWTLDLAGPWRGVRPHVVSDALRPALRGRFPLVVAANLLRHVWPQIRERGPEAWPRLVAPGGALWILEDEPLQEPAPAANYRRLQDILARLQPGDHRPLLAQAEFLRRQAAWCWPGRWRFGTLDNRWPASAARVLAMLASGQPHPAGEVADLMNAIERDGIGYGRAWWARWEPEAAT